MRSLCIVVVLALLLPLVPAAPHALLRESATTQTFLGLLPRFGHAARTPLFLCDRVAVMGTDRGVVGTPVTSDDGAYPFFDALPGITSLHLISPHRLLALAGSTVALYRCDSSHMQRTGKYVDRTLVFDFFKRPTCSDEPHFQPLRMKASGPSSGLPNATRFVVVGSRAVDTNQNVSMVVAFDEDMLQMEWAAVAPGHTSAFPVQASTSSLWVTVGNASGSLVVMKLRGSVGKVLPKSFDTGLPAARARSSSTGGIRFSETFVVVARGELFALSTLGIASLARLSWRNTERFTWVVRQHKLSRCTPTLPPVRFHDSWYVFCGASVLRLSTDTVGRRPPSAAQAVGSPVFLATSSTITHYKVIANNSRNASREQSFLVIVASGGVHVLRGGANRSVKLLPSSEAPLPPMDCVGVESVWWDGAPTLIVPCARLSSSSSGGFLLFFRLTTAFPLVRVCELDARPLGVARARHGPASGGGLRIFLPARSASHVVGVTRLFLTGRDTPLVVVAKPGWRGFAVIGAQKDPRELLVVSNCTVTLVRELDGEQVVTDTCRAFGSSVWEIVRVTPHHVLLFLTSRADVVVAVSFGSSRPTVATLPLCEAPIWWSPRPQHLFHVRTLHGQAEVFCSSERFARRQAVVLSAGTSGDVGSAWTIEQAAASTTVATPLQFTTTDATGVEGGPLGFVFSRWVRASHFRRVDNGQAADRFLLVVLNESIWVCNARPNAGVLPATCGADDEVVVRYSHPLGIRYGAWCRSTEPQFDDDRGLLLFLDWDGWLNAMPVALGRVLWRMQHFHANYSSEEVCRTPSTLAQFCGAHVFFRNHKGLVVAVDALTGRETRVFGGSTTPVAQFDFVGLQQKQHALLYTLHEDGQLLAHRFAPHRTAYAGSGLFPRDCMHRSHLEADALADASFTDSAWGALHVPGGVVWLLFVFVALVAVVTMFVRRKRSSHQPR